MMNLIFFGVVLVTFILLSSLIGRMAAPGGGQIPSTDLLFALRNKGSKGLAPTWAKWVAKRARKDDRPTGHWSRPVNAKSHTLAKLDELDPRFAGDPITQVRVPDLSAF